MRKSNICILVLSILALLFCSMDAEAANINSVLLTQIYTEPTTNTYKFDIGADNVVISSQDGTTSSVYSYTSGVLEFSFDTGKIQSLTLSSSDAFNYDYLTFRISPNLNWSSGFNAEDTAAYRSIYEFVRPYLVVNGVKYYIKDYGYTDIVINPSISPNWGYLGYEIDLSISFADSYTSLSDIRTLFGSYTFSVSLNASPYYLYGYTYVSTGENSIIDSVEDSGNSIVTAIQNFASSISTQLSTWKNDFATQMRSWQSALDDKLDEVIETLTKSFDTSSAESTNTELSGTLDSWEAAEGTTMENAQIDVGEYDTASAFQFVPALISSLTLITTFSNSFFVASGDFSTALIVMIALVFVSVVVGLIRFVK